ncbi:MAG TPA: NAD(P)-dependent alcohol dehydrogenase [Gammaproteobacteria bacterium]|jgi:NADPH:quinone reductase-like Zn-dependent oxidoreductase
MKAIIHMQYGSRDVLHLSDIEEPTPKEGEVLLKVQAASLNAMDWHLMRGSPFFIRLAHGLLRPKVTGVGIDVAGVVEAVGTDVSEFKPGDAVFGTCRGAFAEYACTKPERLALKPKNISFEAAATVPIAGFTALQALRNAGKIQAGQRVVIDGAGGGVGNFAVLLAKAFGAEVTAVCSTANQEWVRALGADYVMDYSQEDFTRGGRHYDLIFGANAFHSLFAYRRALIPKGIYVMTGGSVATLLQCMLLGPLLSLTGGRKFRIKGAKPRQEDLLVLSGLLEAGKLKPAIDQTYELSEATAAMRYIESKHAKGKVVISIA